MDDNRLKLGDGGPSTGPARTGQGLLAGLLRCGRCGRKFYVALLGQKRDECALLLQGRL